MTEKYISQLKRVLEHWKAGENAYIHIEALEAAIAELELPCAPREDWQPIESAPEDEWILASQPDDAVPYVDEAAKQRCDTPSDWAVWMNMAQCGLQEIWNAAAELVKAPSVERVFASGEALFFSAESASEIEGPRMKWHDLEAGAKSRWNAAAALLCAPRTEVPQQAWLPIESAPKDGTHVLLTDFETAIVAYWHGALSSWDASGRSSLFKFYRPTHWMPLPAPPAPEAKSLGQVLYESYSFALTGLAWEKQTQKSRDEYEAAAQAVIAAHQSA